MSRFSSPIAAELALLAAGMIAGLSGEALLFLEAQARGVERGLREDFRILLFLKADLSEGRLQVLEEKVRALPSASEVRYVSRDRALEELRREDPELVDSVALLGENPLSSAFEVRPSADALVRVPQWAEAAYALPEIADVRYKPEELRTILQARFLVHCLGFVLSALLCLTGLVAAAALFLLYPLKWSPAASRWAAAAATGAGLGMGLTYALVQPMRSFSPFWAWPGAAPQVLLAAAAAAGGALAAQWRRAA